MKRNKIVAANWKMNTLHSEAVSLAGDILAKTLKVREVKKIIFPPFPFINDVAILLQETEGFGTGAQNCSQYEKGAYTGEVSAAMLKSVGAGFVLVGHSERRLLFNESPDILLAKLQTALQSDLTVVYCFGEQLNERKSGIQHQVVKQQLSEVLGSLSKTQMNQLVLAYEPVWAIGTGETANPQQAQDMHAFVRQCLEDLFGKEISDQTSILYGGSCNAQNARELFACRDVDGGLIGGASLKADEFAAIVNSF